MSLLTRVDGLVLMRPGLEVRGFGVEITTKVDPKELYIAAGPFAAESGLRLRSIEDFGTRHRSMMRYCAKYDGSIGFVISQDGHVRAITRVGKKLVMWENLRLQVTSFVPPKRRKGGSTKLARQI